MFGFGIVITIITERLIGYDYFWEKTISLWTKERRYTEVKREFIISFITFFRVDGCCIALNIAFQLTYMKVYLV